MNTAIISPDEIGARPEFVLVVVFGAVASIVEDDRGLICNPLEAVDVSK